MLLSLWCVGTSYAQVAIPVLNTPVIDEASVLTEAEKTQISQDIMAIHQSGFAQIGVVLVATTQGEAIFDYSTRVFKQWQLGDAARDNGLIIVVAVDDRKIQILTGYGLEGVLPDIMVKQIIRDHMAPYFKNRRYGVGLQDGIEKIRQQLEMDPETRQQAQKQLSIQSDRPNNTIFFLLAGVLFVLPVVNVLLTAMVGRGHAGLILGGIGGLITYFMLGGLLVAILVAIAVCVSIWYELLSGRGSSRRSGGGFGGGGGYSGGGGSFGGGGASGSW